MKKFAKSLKNEIVLIYVYWDENILAVIFILQNEEFGHRKRYEETLLKIMDSFLLDDELPADEQGEIIRIFADLRRELRELRKPESPEELDSQSAANGL